MNERKLNPSPRVEDTREKEVPGVIRFALSEIKKHFDEDIKTLNLQKPLLEQLTSDEDKISKDLILKSQVVLLESAFDFYLHELTKFGVTQMFEKRWDTSDKYKNILVKLETVERIIDNGTVFFDFVNEHYSKATMVSFESLKDQMNLLGLKIENIAEKLFYEEGSTKKPIDKMKNLVNGLFSRRNIIAHQSNREHSNAEVKSINEEEVTIYINHIVKIVDEIHEAASNQGKK